MLNLQVASERIAVKTLAWASERPLEGVSTGSDKIRGLLDTALKIFSSALASHHFSHFSLANPSIFTAYLFSMSFVSVTTSIQVIFELFRGGFPV
jgi:hypothetical protein